MIIVNTTFVMESALSEEILQWIKDKYIMSAERYSHPSIRPLVTKVLNAPDPQAETYAIHVYFEYMAQAEKWAEGVGASLRKILAERWGERVLTFHTYLEVTE